MKTVCIYHSIDLDGWMSAAIVKHWFNQQRKTYVKSKVFKEVDVDFGIIDFIGYNHGQPIPDLSEYDKVIMVDVSLPKEEMYKLFIQKSGNFIWIDHHISAIKDSEYESFQTNKFGTKNENLVSGLRDIKFAACELTWKYFFPNKPMPEIVRLLGMYDSFRHKGTDEEQKVLEFQYGARQVIVNYEDAYKWLLYEINEPIDTFANDMVVFILWDKGEAIYQYLVTEAKQVYKNGFPIYFDIILNDDNNIPNCKMKLKFFCINRESFNPINFGIDYHKDGYDGVASFLYADNKWNFSLYNDNDLVDCSIIAKQYGGGGHKYAAGFIIDDINKIIKR